MQQPDKGPRLMRRQEVERRTALGASTIYRRMKDGEFPRPRVLGGGVVRWLEDDVEAWISSLDQQAA